MPPCLLLGLLGGCLLTHWASGSNLNCTPEQYQHDGRCCSRCGPGDKLLSDCTASKNTDCGACEAGHFQSSWTKERHCTPHRSCDHNAGLLTRSPGDTKHNAVCECLQGMYCSSPDCQTCLKITNCRPGEGVARKADNFSDTACVPCEHGSFSNTSSTSEPCRPWTRCETLGLVLKTTGTNLSDVACGKCQAACGCQRAPAVQIPEPGRGRSPVLISIMAVSAACLVGLILFCLYQKGLQQRTQKQGLELPDPVEIVVLATAGCEEHDERQDFPVQETLLGRQPVAQEDGKESRISEQERL
ncbi:tumor necrosis factor receptor superfamily member 5 isoform X2 [Dermochelys coriacea]|uniref:tumor necrosis factor receptor superfamily member 5 isoform X2 n=1 Tax=Dermochelys coriacea TaxID=27794 RepID=UPI001CA9285C|nr:tumor necrosis factor receptor superfamily member 5 isoform X2 [Dermochelys coriacea]